MKKYLAILIILSVTAYCSAQSFVNPSLESWSTATYCETNTPPDGWSNYSNVGLGPDEGNLVLCPSTIPPVAADGDIFCRCLAGNPNTGEGMYQNVSGFIPGMNYLITYDYCGTNRWGGNGDCVWHLFIDDVDVNISPVFSSADTTWDMHSFIFTATAAMHKIGFRAYTPTYNGGGSAAIDHFSLRYAKTTGFDNDLSSAGTSVYPNPFLNSLSVSSNVSNATFILNDILGRVIMKKDFSNSVTVNTETLPAGIYLYKLESAGRAIKNDKLVKE
jgi:hypothetical protein